jgi:hypothetical protein
MFWKKLVMWKQAWVTARKLPGKALHILLANSMSSSLLKNGPARFKIVAHGQQKIFHNDLQDTLTYALPSVFHDRHACAQERNTFHDFCSWFGKN